MPVFNYLGKEVNLKVVYYGPGLSGKTTNIQYIHGNIRPDFKGKLVSLATQTDRTLFFDFLPMELGMLGGYKIRLHLYTVPGQVHYNATRKLVLKGVDGVVLVADSQRAMQETNQESLTNLEKNLESYGKGLKDLPHVIQCNKRDLHDLLSMDELNAQLNPYKAPIMEAVASEGEGVLECLREILRLVMRSLRDQFPPQEPDAEPLEKSPSEAGVEVIPEPGPSDESESSQDYVGETDESEVMLEVPEEEALRIPEPEVTVNLEAPEGPVSTGQNDMVVLLPIPGGGEMEVAVRITARLTKTPVFEEIEDAVPEPDPEMVGSQDDEDQDTESPSEGPPQAAPDEPYDPSFRELQFTDFDGDSEPEGGKGKKKGFFGRLRKKK